MIFLIYLVLKMSFIFFQKKKKKEFHFKFEKKKSFFCQVVWWLEFTL